MAYSPWQVWTDVVFLSNVAQVSAPLLSSCQSATAILTSSSQRDRVEREQLQAETTWQTSFKSNGREKGSDTCQDECE